jgi:hypothetical protein
MNRIIGTYEQGRVIVDTPADWPDGSRVEVSLLSLSSGDGRNEAINDIRKEFLDAMNDSNRVGLEDSLWPSTPGEREIWLKWFDSRESLDLSAAEQERMEAFWNESKALQKELVKKSWENKE